MKTIGLMSNYFSGYIFPQIISGAERVLRDRGYRLMLYTTRNDKAKEKQGLEMMLESGVSGLIIEPTRSAQDNVNAPLYAELSRRGIPYVMISGTYEGLSAPCLRADDERASFLATEHLIELGHRVIAGFFKIDEIQGIDRMKGFISAHQKHQIPVPSHLINQYTTDQAERKPEKDAFMLLQREQRPTAFVCFNDWYAIAMLEVTRQMGLQVPDDVSVVSFDDSEMAVATEVKLTSVSHAKEKLGEQAAQHIIDIVEGRKHMELYHIIVEEPKLIMRSSTTKLNG